jgi:RNA polymerase-binding protein DksA
MGKKLNVDKFKKLLHKERDRLVSERHATTQEELESGLELSDYDNHPADAASETFERTKNYALDENFREIIDSIDEALRKIEDGTYGTCDRCAQPIKVDRLKAIPYATLCIQCQETIERR